MGQGAGLRLGNDQRTKAGMNITGDDTGESKSLAEGQEMNTGGRYQRQQNTETVAHDLTCQSNREERLLRSNVQSFLISS